jgi:translation initiation factor 2D
VNQLEVLVQGKQSKAVNDYLMDKGIPKKWIDIEDTTEKKKGK